LTKGIHKTNKYLNRFLSNLIHQENHLLKNREMHINYTPAVNDTVNKPNDTVNDTVFNLIKQDNKITASEISERLIISLSTVNRKIKELKDKGILERIGSDKTGYWKIIE
jgi:predicted HTH transcriptional regulator